MIDIGGGHQVWTKKVGSAAIKVLLLHGGPGADHSYFGKSAGSELLHKRTV
jgi:proline iminopeptidase